MEIAFRISFQPALNRGVARDRRVDYRDDLARTQVENPLGFRRLSSATIKASGSIVMRAVTMFAGSNWYWTAEGRRGSGHRYSSVRGF